MLTYAYDILLNFNKDYFDFFEWNNEDNIIHIKKIPLIKVSNYNFHLFKNSLIKFENDFVSNLFNKTEIFSKKKNTTIYAFLISNGHEVIGIKLNKNKINAYKSSLLLDEEDEIANIAFNMKETKIKYSILKHNDKNCFKTRKEKMIENNIIKSIDKLYRNNEKEKLQFLYLECFNLNEKNINKIYYELKKEILEESKSIKTIDDFFKIVQKK